jgi:transposase
LRGRVTRHHRFLLQFHLKQIGTFDDAIASIESEVAAHVEPIRTMIEQLKTIPGISELGPCTILAEIGRDISRSQTDAHLISWAVLCPRNDKSAGKRRSSRMRKGAPWLKTVLIQCAWTASRKKNSHLQVQFQRLRARRGPETRHSSRLA